MTRQERLAHRHLFGTAKATHGRTDAAAQSEVENTSHPARDLLSNDPEVLQLASDGIDAFMVRTAQRILDKHSDEITFKLLSSMRCDGQDAESPTMSFLLPRLALGRLGKLLVSRITGHVLTTPLSNSLKIRRVVHKASFRSGRNSLNSQW
jgi:hypothetical protein